MSGVFPLARAGRWLLHSGIQNPAGGVARYYRADTETYKAVSNEITGYHASALVFLHRVTGQAEYLDRATLTAHFLCDHAWDSGLRTFPFEHPSPSGAGDHHSYFFDCGIIVRGLMAVWRATSEDRLLEIALAAARGMMADFRAAGDYHPILQLPSKLPLARDARWSRSPGCYQLKAALGWWEVAEVTGDAAPRDAYLEMLTAALRTHHDFLPGADDRSLVMDRLHAYSYFLEALTPVLNRPECVEAYRYGLGEVSRHLRAIAPEFARSDVYAQLLRARLYAAAVIPVDRALAAEEATALAGFQTADGGFYFGRRGNETVPHVNPVSTAFAVEALALWDGFPCPALPI